MGWFSGHLGKIDVDISNSYTKIDNFSTKWEKDGHKLSSFISKSPIELELNDNTKVINGKLFYEYLKDTKRIIKEGRKFKVVVEKNVIDTQWTDFWFTEKSFILIKKGETRKKGFELLSKALTGEEGNITACNFNIKGIFEENPYQWMGAFRDREGNIHRGIFYGENIVQDEEMGDAYTRTIHKNQVGFMTNYFGAENKVRITRKGFIQIHSLSEEDIDKVFQFIRDELSAYILED